MTYFPSEFSYWRYLLSGKEVLVALALVGAVVGMLLPRQHRVDRTVLLSATVLFAIALITHVLTAWILLVDPHRGSGNVPLPSPWSEVAEAGLLVLVCVAPWLGPLVIAACGRRLMAWRERPVLPLAAVAALYTLWVTPWMSIIIAD